MKKVKIAILGLGNVGKGVWNIFNTNKKEICMRSGYDIEISKILVRDPHKDRGVKVPEGLLTTDIDEILMDDDIKIVVELMGGSEPALDYMLKAMKKKKHVVTANKLVIATQGEGLFETAEKEGVLFYYEASVGGGIPIIREINESLTANKIEEVVGIVNGTTNYILSKMTLEGLSFDLALKEAQEKGYAEANPTSDIEGYDVSYKLAIMASLAFGTKLHVDSIYREGISNIKSEDIDYAKKLGYTIKLLAIAKEVDEQLELRVHPTMIPLTHPLANVNDSFNAIFIKGNAVGDLMLYGRGAGALPTGSAVVGDIISILRNNIDKSVLTDLKINTPTKKVLPTHSNSSEYYIRLNVKDKVGVLAEITTIFGVENVNIFTVTQQIKGYNDVSIIFVTHKSLERNMLQAIEKIKGLDAVNGVESLIRIENF